MRVLENCSQRRGEIIIMYSVTKAGILVRDT